MTSQGVWPLISVKCKRHGMGGITSKNMGMLFHWNLTNKVWHAIKGYELIIPLKH